jgi:hypothetical protein
MNPHFLPTTGEKLTDAQRLDFLRQVVEAHNLSHNDLARFTGYARDSVSGWFTEKTSPRHRAVPVRAFDRLLNELRLGTVKGSK